MGRVAEQGAEHLVVTDDNPRTESGDKIVDDILQGVQSPEDVSVIRDREHAIRHAINRARSNDIVLVAGKGHETYQESNGEKRAFSDSAVARLALQERSL